MRLSLVTGCLILAGLLCAPLINAIAASSTLLTAEQIVRFPAGATRARICLDQAERSNQYRNNKYFDFVTCVSDTYADTSYLSEPEELEASALFIAAFFIQIDHFGKITGGGDGYGSYGVSCDKLIRSQYDLGIRILKRKNLEKENVCDVVKWINCSKLPLVASIKAKE